MTSLLFWQEDGVIQIEFLGPHPTTATLGIQWFYINKYMHDDIINI